MIDHLNKENILQHFSITENDLLKVINEALGKGGDYADIFFEHTFSNSISLRDGEVNRAASNIDFGVGIRVVSGDQTGYAYVENTEITELLKYAFALSLYKFVDSLIFTPTIFNLSLIAKLEPFVSSNLNSLPITASAPL